MWGWVGRGETTLTVVITFLISKHTPENQMGTTIFRGRETERERERLTGKDIGIILAHKIIPYTKAQFAHSVLKLSLA